MSASMKVKLLNCETMLTTLGQVLRVVHASGGADGVWLKVDARRNAGTAWKTFVGGTK